MRHAGFLVAGTLLLASAMHGSASGPAAATSRPPAPRPARGQSAPAVPSGTTRATAPVRSHAPGVAAARQTELVKTYCATCHSERGRAGGLSLAGFDATRVHEQPEQVEKIIRKLRTGMMPPAGARRPDEATIAALAGALETRMDEFSATSPNPGWRPFQRLNRAEYARAIESLFGIPVDVTAFLPPDTISKGFDNVADVQGFSPALMEGYLRAASQISRVVVGDRTASPTSVTYKVGRTMSQMRHVEGAPVGTRGGISVTHVFPADGEYVIRTMLHNEPLGGLYGRNTMSYLGTEQVEVSIDGERVALFELKGSMQEGEGNGLDLVTPRLHLKAGPHRVSAAFLLKLEAAPDDLLVPLENTLADVSMGYGVTLLPHLRDMTVVGPHRVTGVSDTVSRRRIFTCRPTTADDEAPCAEAIVRRLAADAFRTQPSAEDVQGLLRFYRQARARGDFEAGIRAAVQAILASPQFLFRTEATPPTLRAGQTYQLSDTELATRLSFFLWATGPDAELLKAAAQGQLRTRAGLERQVRRLLADPRAETLSTRFASQWLRLQDLDKIIPDYLQFPHYDDTLAAGFRRETELFFESLVREDRSLLTLLDADYTFVNERVALHYGIPNVTGAGFRRVSTPPERRGLLGHGSILTLTSIADRTSPVQRGKWVMEVLLGSPPPAPPPNVPSLDESVKGTTGGRTLSVRERMEQHRANPACTSCHRVIDPLGLALENYDVTGAWRIKDNEVPVDAVGTLYDGTAVDGPAGLRAALLRHKDAVVLSFTENLMTYATGRRVEFYDLPSIRAVVRDAEARDLRLSAFILGVVNSPAFRMSRVTSVPETTTAPDARH